ncbi:MAG: DUF63 family protein [Methanocalculus sp. MSAO_Arc1]|uniref:DUF63 family protein n=1 Tax=Methanocalculus TaxID=71151 RepID=UPI000FF0BE08|nr:MULTISPECIES: DUF63 family protein [unclassified Methanocalculus]MCP1662424.1 putative membrane protein [Methanocalculus sp. AMF5]RQD79488.1 MAG: DUF63 family protein [Methanocalculus sp. MSAO_Arc1]
MISDFIYKYYIDPIRYGEAYTLVDTLTYALILIISVFLVSMWLTKRGIVINADFVKATIPYVVLGGLIRVIEDTGMIQSDYRFLLITPLIFFTIFFITVISLLLSGQLEKAGFTKSYLTPYALLGSLYSLVAFCLLLWWGVTQTVVDIPVMVIILVMAAMTTLATIAAIRYLLRWEYVSNPLYGILIFGHLLDASATSYGIDFHPIRYIEQHVVGAALIDWSGTAFSMFPLKLAVLIPGIYILEMYRRENGDSGLWYLLLLAMIVVGMAPGIRGMMRMVIHV